MSTTSGSEATVRSWKDGASKEYPVMESSDGEVGPQAVRQLFRVLRRLMFAGRPCQSCFTKAWPQEEGPREVESPKVDWTSSCR